MRLILYFAIANAPIPLPIDAEKSILQMDYGLVLRPENANWYTNWHLNSI
jgi:hypothetical protein